MKGRRRRTAIALKNMRRTPEEMFPGAVLFSMKVAKNRQMVMVRKMRREKNRGG